MGTVEVIQAPGRKKAGRPPKAMKEHDEAPKGLWIRKSAKTGKVSYYARFYIDGEWHRQKLKHQSYRDACKELINLQGRAIAGDYGWKSKRTEHDWEALRDRYFKFNRQSGKRRPQEYERDIKNFEAFRKLKSVSQIDEELIAEFRYQRMNGLIENLKNRQGQVSRVSARTVNREVGTLKHLLNKAVDWGVIDANPLARLKPVKQAALRKERRPLTADEVKRIKKLALPGFKLIVRTFLTTGIRHKELVRLRFSHIDWKTRELIVVAENSKNGKSRRIPLTDTVFKALRRLKLLSRGRNMIPDGLTAPDRDHVFLTKAGTPLENNLLRQFRRSCKRAGIDDGWQPIVPGEKLRPVDIHSLRYTFASKLAEDGAHPKTAQELLGHSSLEMTMRIYTKVNNEAKRKAIENLDAWK